MPKTISQKILFKNRKVNELYELYMDAKKHSFATGSTAKISRKIGADFSAHDGYITGENLHLVKDRLIVQSWRAQDWKKTDPDSIFMINFEQKGKDSFLHIVHANLPDEHAESINKGWHDFYWKPWKQVLAGKPGRKPVSM